MWYNWKIVNSNKINVFKLETVRGKENNYIYFVFDVLFDKVTSRKHNNRELRIISVWYNYLHYRVGVGEINKSSVLSAALNDKYRNWNFYFLIKAPYAFQIQLISFSLKGKNSTTNH